MNACGDLQTALDLERKKNARLQEQVERLRQENYSQANECKPIGIVYLIVFFTFQFDVVFCENFDIVLDLFFYFTWLLIKFIVTY